MASAPKISRAFSLSATLLVAVAAPGAFGSPLDTASDVHEKGGYPDAIQPVDVPLPPEIAIDSEMGSETKPKGDPSEKDGGAPTSGPGSDWGDGERRDSDGKPAPRSQEDPEARRAPGVRIGGGSILGPILLIVALGVLAAFFAMLLASWRGRTEDPKAKVATDGVPEPAPREPRLELDADSDADADALAAAGRLGEAIFVLLVRALRHVGWEPAGTGQSSTARDVLGKLGAGDPRRRPLEALIGLAEGVRFAGRSPTQDLFAAVRARYEELHQAGARAAG